MAAEKVEDTMGKTGFWVKDKKEALKEGKEQGMPVWKARGVLVSPGGSYFIGNKPSSIKGIVWEEIKE